MAKVITDLTKTTTQTTQQQTNSKHSLDTQVTLTKQQSESKPTVIFGHHPCPDGLASLVVLADKFGLEASTTYVGLNHGPLDIMQKQIQEALKTQPIGADIVFVDIIPPFPIVKMLLEKTTCKITLLDHHLTAIKAFEEANNRAFLEPFIKSGRLRLDLDLTRSGVGIAYREVYKDKALPDSISLVQTLDLLTATGDQNVIQQFKLQKDKFTKKHQDLFASVSKKVENEAIKNNIEFYLLAAIIDKEFELLFAKYRTAPLKDLIRATQTFMQSLEKEGVTSLLDKVIIVNGSKATAESLFLEQMEYQTQGIKKAVVTNFHHDPNTRVLYITANIQSGRTFDPLISSALQMLFQPAYAMITDTTEKTISEVNRASLRTANNNIDLSVIAEQLKQERIVANGGGHARASAVQFNQKQFSELLQLVESTVKSAEKPQMPNPVLILSQAAGAAPVQAAGATAVKAAQASMSSSQSAANSLAQTSAVIQSSSSETAKVKASVS